MRVDHTTDTTLLNTYIYDCLYRGDIVCVKQLSQDFQFNRSTIYKKLKRIDGNLSLIGSPYKLIKVSTGCYKLAKIDSSIE